MSVIKQLDISVANLIAAGEVVDRPASCAKELIENALDAGASRIAVDIRGGGVTMLRITDDGCGIAREDLPTAILRHATSKIREASDLARIETLGFRGEALAAIASVSDLRILSKRAEDEEGCVMTVHQGKIVDLADVGCASGTTVLVENLFENVPARRKFLKKEATETASVASVCEKLALARPDVSISFSVHGNLRFKTPGDGDLLHAMRAVWGKSDTEGMLFVSGASFGIKVEGYVSGTEHSRSTRSMQNFFLNGRYVKSRTASAALERAYTSYMAESRFPASALSITLDPSQVDVNVHPTKLEVRFSDESRVFEAVYYAVRAALEENDQRASLSVSALRAPSMEEKGEKLKQVLFDASPVTEQISLAIPKEERKADTAMPEQTPEQEKHDEGFLSVTGHAPSTVLRADDVKPFPQNITASDFLHHTEESKSVTPPPPMPEEKQNAAEEAKTIPQYRILGVLFHCYVVVETEDKCLLIDQHAADERIHFERMKKSLAKIPAQELLIPLSVSLSREECEAVLARKEMLSELGLTVARSADGDMTVLLTSIPCDVSPYEASSLLSRIASELLSSEGDPAVTDALRREKALYSIACKAAIKGGRDYDGHRIDRLVRDILTIPDITVCPHGRPVVLELSHDALNRRFGRS